MVDVPWIGSWPGRSCCWAMAALASRNRGGTAAQVGGCPFDRPESVRVKDEKAQPWGKNCVRPGRTPAPVRPPPGSWTRGQPGDRTSLRRGRGGDGFRLVFPVFPSSLRPRLGFLSRSQRQGSVPRTSTQGQGRSMVSFFSLLGGQLYKFL